MRKSREILDSSPAQAEARARFPRGLVQPATGYRFSLDALLLAAFSRPRGHRGVDLGCGCGVVALALLLGHGEGTFSVQGVDLNPEMMEAARANAWLLGLSDRFTAGLGDVAVLAGRNQEAGEASESAARDGGDQAMEGRIAGAVPGCEPLSGPVRHAALESLALESFDFALCNPPYFQAGHGRACPDPGRGLARCAEGAGIAEFAGAAGRLLKNGGRAAFIFPAERLAGLLSALAGARLEPKRLRFVHSRAGEPARLVLAEAVKNAAPGLRVEPPLVLYGPEPGSRALSSEALAFCPFLGCNPNQG
jgi:tRNA1(Val) A37 N6-methylase TrmN6